MNNLRHWSLPLLSLLLITFSDSLLFLKLHQLWLIPTITYLLLPGTLLFLLINRKRCSMLTAGLCSFGLSIALLLGLGLAINQLHWLAQINQPLSQFNFLVGLNIVLLVEILLITALRTKASLAMLRLPKPRMLDIVTLIISLIVITLSILGANLLNYGGSNLLAIASTIFIGIIPFYIIFLRKHISTWSYLIALFGMSAGLLFLSSLRSNFLTGSDVLNEFHVFRVVAQQGFWNISQIRDTYNACLSVTILPQVIGDVSGQNGLYIFRVIFQLIFSISPIIVFAIGRLFMNPLLAFLSGVSFLSFSDFISSMPNHVRQEVALLFFALMILLMTTRELSRNLQKILLLVFGLAMVVSHYSTAYVAILLLIGCIIFKACGKLSRPKFVGKVFHKDEALAVSGYITLILLLFTVFWYSQIFSSSGGPISYVKSVTTKIISNGYDNQQAAGTSLQSQFTIFGQFSSNPELFTQFLTSKRVDTQSYNPQLSEIPVSQERLQPSILNSGLRLLIQIWNKVYKFLVLAGIIFIIFSIRKRPKKIDATYRSLVFASALVILASFIIPSFTVNYDQYRLFQQLLVILAAPLVYTTYAFLNFRKKVTYYCLAIFLGTYVCISIKLLGQISGGVPLPIQFNNYGEDYSRLYVHSSEVLSADWLVRNHERLPVYSDTYGANRINFATTGLNPITSLIPSDISKNSLIYYDYANTINDVTFIFYKNGTFMFSAPTTYLQTNTSEIYSNGSSRVYEKS